jgi:hypothetical protein
MKTKPRRAHPEVADEAFGARLAEVLGSPEFREAMIQRLVAASMDAADSCCMVENAVERMWEEARGSKAELTRRLIRSIEAGCARYAEIRGLPYQRVVGPLTRVWKSLMSAAREAGLTDEEGYAVMRDLLRKIPASHWSRVKEIDKELLAELKFGFRVIGFSKGGGKSPVKS